MAEARGNTKSQVGLYNFEAYWKSYAENVPEHILVLDTDLKIEWVNRLWSGLAEDRLIGTEVADWAPESQRAMVREKLARVLRCREPETYQTEFELPDGGSIHYESLAIPRLHEAELSGVIVTARDITADMHAQTALRNLMKASDDIVNSIPSGLFIYQMESPDRLTLLSANPEAERLTGVEASEWVGKEFNQIWPNARADGVTEAYLKVMDTGETLETEDLHYRDDRLDGAFRTRAFRLPNERLAVAFESVTERKRAEEARRHTDLGYSQLFETIGSCVAVYEPVNDGEDFVFVDFNAAAERHSEARREDIVGKRVTEVFPGVRDIGLFDLFQRVHSTGTPAHLPLRQYKDNRISEWVENTVYRLPNGNIVAVYEDTSDQRIAEQALKESEEEALQILAATTDGIWKRNFKTGELFFSDRYYTMLGYDPGAFAPTFDSWHSLIHPDDLERILAADKAYHESGMDEYENEYRMRTATDEYRWIRTRGRVVERDEHGDVVRMIGNHEDVTERKDAELHKIQLEQQIQQAQKLESLGVLAGGIAHDFNNLLMAVIGHADIAVRKLPATSPAQESIRKIQGAATRAAELADQMLAYSGRGRFVVQPVSLSEIVWEMGHLLKASVSKTTLLHYELSDSLPSVEVDVTQVRQVVMNLIINASEALQGQAGVVRVTTGTVECDEATLSSALLADDCAKGSYVYVEVTDTGTGLEEGTIARMFDPFFTTKFTGRGLGLAAVFGIVRGHKGAITVRSELGEGTTIKVLIPASDAPLENRSECKEEETSPAVGGTVLLVDDEVSVLDIGASMLDILGYDVVTAQDGMPALDVFDQHHRDIVCVILDLTMPKSSGEEALSALRERGCNVPVLLSSGFSAGAIEAHLAEAGFAGFLKKPYDIDQLEVRLVKALRD